MLSLAEARRILGDEAPRSDEELEALLERMDKLARTLLAMAREKRQAAKQ